jgi:uncharacterized protein YecE (DUF72 family)
MKSRPTGDIRIGTSGWSYPSGDGSWNGIFYPAPGAPGRSTGSKKKAKFDELAYYADHFDTVEVNSSFYRPPSHATAESWVRRTPPGFEFSLKLYQKFTHPDMFRKATGQDDATVHSKDVDQFKLALDPIADAGKLGALLAQFPASFKDSPAAREYLAALLRTFRDYPVAVELRHRSWSDAAADVLDVLAEHNSAWAQIDEPKFKGSIRQNFAANTRGFYYMRLHGRNAAKWWKHDTSDERYNYLYSADELKPFADTAVTARKEVKKIYAYMNNHFEAKAVANAVTLKQQLGLDTPGDYPPEFVARYPELAGRIATSQPPLLRTSS